MSVGVFDWGDVCGAVDNFGIYGGYGSRFYGFNEYV
jgi:hypothetical protein